MREIIEWKVFYQQIVKKKNLVFRVIFRSSKLWALALFISFQSFRVSMPCNWYKYSFKCHLLIIWDVFFCYLRAQRQIYRNFINKSYSFIRFVCLSVRKILTFASHQWRISLKFDVVCYCCVGRQEIFFFITKLWEKKCFCIEKWQSHTFLVPQTNNWWCVRYDFFHQNK